MFPMVSSLPRPFLLLLLHRINVRLTSNFAPMSNLEPSHSTEVRPPASPLNLTSSTVFAFSGMSLLGLKVWQGQCTLISSPRLFSAERTRRAEEYWEPTLFFFLSFSTFPQDHYPSFAFGGKSNKVRVQGRKKKETWGASRRCISHSFTVLVTSKEIHSDVPLVLTFLPPM